MTAAAFPFTTTTWVLLWLVPAAALAMLVAWRTGFQRNVDQSSSVAEAYGNRMVLRTLLAAFMIPAALFGWLIEDTAKAFWNDRFGTCIQLLPVADAELALEQPTVHRGSELASSCTLTYRQPPPEGAKLGRTLLEMELATFSGRFDTAFEYQVDRMRGAAVILGLPWERDYAIVRKERGRTVLLLEMRRGAALRIDARKELRDEAIWRLVDGIAKRESAADPAITSK